ncbi:PucR family transcriptional regulator [Sporichthya polymorpha]|uniref:PucR family transcriptional regulator n=1 Tax=Sporichthya polymorpha TaxID=35751 RepID=UPI000371E02E|nr:helix-turn-helix domain-containing protein [Sporichthya polymorpha]
MTAPGADELSTAAMRAMAARTDPDELAAAVSRDTATHVWPEHVRDPIFLDALRKSGRDNVRAIVDVLAGRLRLEDVNPTGALAFADLTAELGIPVSELERGYWVGVRGFWREWFRLARIEAAKGEGTLEELVGPATIELLDYIIHIVGIVVARYDAVRAEILRNQEDRRRALLGQILAHAITTPTSELENLLGYRLRGTHLALALEVDERAQAERVASTLTETSGALGSLMLLHAPGTWMLWLGYAGAVGPKETAAVARAAAATGATMAIGAPGTGLDGLRRTYEQALDAARLHRRIGKQPPVLWFSDVRLELLMLHDEDAALQFVADELGELAGADERAVRTCETLLAWLTTGSQSRAATRLGVHENTVRIRIRHAEEVLAQGLSERRAEVLAALRLRQLLGPPSAR